MGEIPQAEDREQRLIEAVVSLAQSFREERDRLARRLSQLEREIDALAVRLDQQERDFPETALPSARPPAPTHTPS
jgi:chromosome segregation ATPase